MAIDKAIDSTQLDTDLTSVANAIRTKGGTSAALTFPAEFISAIAAIPTGGGGGESDLSKLCNGTLARLDDDGITNVKSQLLRVYSSSASLTAIFLKNLVTLESGYCFGAPSLQTCVLPGLQTIENTGFYFSGATHLTALDIGPSFSTNNYGIRTNAFSGASALTTVILRKSTAVVPLGATNVFNNTPFKSGGTGGTIYIPKALYDHLGDGGSLDYKAATNWSTVNGYGTITWAKIEGSQYENYYADGTPVT